MMINLYYKSSSRCVCLESALLCVKKGQVTSRYYSSPSLPSVEAWYFSLRGCNRLLRGSCWKWTAEAESVNLLTSPGSVTKLVCQRAIYVLGGGITLPSQMLASWEEGSVGFSPFKFCGNIVFDSSCVQLQLKAGGHLLGMMKIFSPCSIMIIVALLVATVSATKLNVPRLRLSHKGNLSIYLSMGKSSPSLFYALGFFLLFVFFGRKVLVVKYLSDTWRRSNNRFLYFAHFLLKPLIVSVVVWAGRAKLLFFLGLLFQGVNAL